MAFSDEYLAMLIIGGVFATFGFTGICISLISLYFTHLSIYSKTFFIVSIIMFLIGLVLVVVSTVTGDKTVNTYYAPRSGTTSTMGSVMSTMGAVVPTVTV